MQKMRIVLADDHQIVRQGMRALLNAQPDIQVVGEASDGYELLDLVWKLKPQVVITDIAMPNLNGIEAARQIRARQPSVQVIVLSMYSNTSYVLRALRAGAQAYLLKDDDFTEVLRAVNAVYAGRRYLSPQVSEKVLDALLMHENNHPEEAEVVLTPREREMIQLVLEGNTSQQIAEKLNISIRTVEKHRANFKSKLGLHSQADLMRFAIAQGIVALQD